MLLSLTPDAAVAARIAGSVNVLGGAQWARVDTHVLSAWARDLVTVATCLTYDLEAIVSPDEDIDRIGEVGRIAVEAVGS